MDTFTTDVSYEKEFGLSLERRLKNEEERMYFGIGKMDTWNLSTYLSSLILRSAWHIVFNDVEVTEDVRASAQRLLDVVDRANILQNEIDVAFDKAVVDFSTEPVPGNPGMRMLTSTTENPFYYEVSSHLGKVVNEIVQQIPDIFFWDILPHLGSSGPAVVFANAERAETGIAAADLPHLRRFFVTILVRGLRTLADEGHSYVSIDGGDADKWKNLLRFHAESLVIWEATGETTDETEDALEFIAEHFFRLWD